jgi:nitrate reductase NapAB chaperone NapD
VATTNQSAEMEKLKAAFEEEKSILMQTHEGNLNAIKTELNEKHAQEIEKIKADMMTMANSSQSEQIEQLMASHQEEIARLRCEAEVSVAASRSSYDNELSAINEKLSAAMSDNESMMNEFASERSLMEQQLQWLRDEKDSVLRSVEEQLNAANAEMEKIKAFFEEEKSGLLQSYEEQVNAIKAELNDIHAQEIEKIKADMMAMSDSSQTEQVEKLMASHNEDIARILLHCLESKLLTLLNYC